MACPSGLHFDEKHKSCTYPEIINRDNPCEYSDMIYFKAHHCDCRKYIYCDNGRVTELDCQNSKFGFINKRVNEVCNRSICRR